jgi:hypothetical protein
MNSIYSARRRNACPHRRRRRRGSGPVILRTHLDTATNGGRAELPRCPGFSSGEGDTQLEIALSVSHHSCEWDYGAARQRRPTKVAVSRWALILLAVLVLLDCRRTVFAQATWQEEFAKMPLARPVVQLDRSNCVQVMLASFRRNPAVKGLIFMPGATDEFYFFHRARAVLATASPTLLDAVAALTNQTYIRATLRPPFLLMHSDEDPLEPIALIQDQRTADRIKRTKFQKTALFYDRSWDYLHPLLSFYLNTKIVPGLDSHATYHFFRHSFAACDLNGWETLEAMAMAGKTRFTVKKRKIVFEGDTRVLGPIPVPEDFLLHPR